MEPTTYDVLRLLSLVTGSMSLGGTGVVAAVYTARYFRHRAAFHRGEVAAWRGLLPRHVAMLGVSHVLLVLLTMVATGGRVREDPDSLLSLVWSPVLLLAYLLALLAMRDVLTHSKYRLTDRTAP